MTNAPNSGPAAPPPPPPVWDARPAATTGAVEYGGFWLRVVAYLIDSVLLGIVGGIVGGLFGALYALSGGGDGAEFGGYMIGIVIAWLYFGFMESSERGATLGKMAVGLRVVTQDGERLSFANATGRYFAKFISAIILGLGFLMVAFEDRKRGLHDMIAGTLVVKMQ